jgi:hypothetical protein
VLFSDLSIAELLNPALKAKKSAIERHHLFPRGYLQKMGFADVHDANQIANFGLVEWSDNIDISDKSPNDYFPAFKNRYSAEEWKKHRFMHALPEGWEKLSYSDFLITRRKLIAEVVRTGFEKIKQ